MVSTGGLVHSRSESAGKAQPDARVPPGPAWGRTSQDFTLAGRLMPDTPNNCRVLAKNTNGTLTTKAMLMSLPRDNSDQFEPLNMAVLVVEDNATNRRVAERLLDKFGCMHVSAENGLEALE